MAKMRNRTPLEEHLVGWYYPMGQWTFPIACAACKNRRTEACAPCKAEKASGFEIALDMKIVRRVKVRRVKNEEGVTGDAVAQRMVCSNDTKAADQTEEAAEA